MAPGSAFSPLGAVGITAAAWASLIVAGVAIVLGGLPAMLALAAGQVCLLLVPVIAMRVTHRPARSLGLVRPQARYLVGAALVGVSIWYVNLHIVSWFELEKYGSVGLEALIDQPPLVVVLLAVALLPAICEEVLFRGALLRGLASRFYAPIAIIATSVVFSLYHLNLAQMVPTFTLGMVLGAIALRSGSTLPTMLVHALNNSLAILVSRGELPALAGWLDRHPMLGLVGATATTTTGLAIAIAGPAHKGARA